MVGNHHFHLFKNGCLGYQVKINGWNMSLMEVWFRSFSFLFMGDGCRFQPLIFQGVSFVRNIFLKSMFSTLEQNFLTTWKGLGRYIYFFNQKLGVERLKKKTATQMKLGKKSHQTLSGKKHRHRWLIASSSATLFGAVWNSISMSRIHTY